MLIPNKGPKILKKDQIASTKMFCIEAVDLPMEHNVLMRD